MKSSTAAVVVVGSFNMDLVVRTSRRPVRGETVMGTEFGMFPGGKGFNQAVAAARLGAHVAMAGRVGADYFGDLFLDALRAEGVRADAVVRDTQAGTGVGLPVIAEDGDNAIVVVPRANMAMAPADVDSIAAEIESADVLLLQLEVPQAVSYRAAEIAHAAGTRVVLNPAPAAAVSDDLLLLADVLTPNEFETQALTGVRPESDVTCREACDKLLACGVRSVVLTLSDRGAFVAFDGKYNAIPSCRVDVVDTTGAGDAFCGALSVMLATGQGLSQAARFANGAAALSVTVMGAYPSMPGLAAVERFLSWGS